eukprot:jgi/Tetstr1/435096/TSEL_024064.t1
MVSLHRSAPPPTLTRPTTGWARGPLGVLLACSRPLSQLYESLFETPRGKGLLMLNALVFLYATNWSVVKMGGNLLDPETFAGLRFGVAALPFLPWLASGLRDAKVRSQGVELAFWSYLAYQAQAISLADTAASKAAFLSTVTVLAVPLLSSLDGRRIQQRTILAAVGAFTGIYRTETHARGLPKESQMPMMSIIMVSLAGLSAASAVGAHPHESLELAEHLGSLPATLAAANLPLPMLAGAVAYTGLATTALTIWLELAALKDVEASDCAIIYSLEPLLGAGVAWWSLGERWGLLGWVGAALIVASTLSAQLGRAEPAETT